MSTNHNEKYTGLIVDCSNLELSPVMSPMIKNENDISIYDYQKLDYEKIVQRGMVSYTRDKSNQTRAGNNPLIVKAIKIDDNNSNPIITVEDADTILLANQTNKFLENCAVVFITQ